MLRVCNCCKKECLLSCFSVNKPTGYAKCKICVSEGNKKYYKENKERLNSSYQTNPKIKERQLKRYQENKESILIRGEEYRKTNLHKYAAKQAKRRSRKLDATPKWLTKVHLLEIENFYWLARDLGAVTGESYHVDHIVPLQGKGVCGLHVPWNLQILPSDINLSKHNKHSP